MAICLPHEAASSVACRCAFILIGLICNKIGRCRLIKKCQEIGQSIGRPLHKTADEIIRKAKEGNLKVQCSKTECTFGREHKQNVQNSIGYMISKNKQPFSLMQDLVDLQEANGITLGSVLQSRKSCGDICKLIRRRNVKSLVTHIIENDSKIGVFIEESTTHSKITSVKILVLRTFRVKC